MTAKDLKQKLLAKWNSPMIVTGSEINDFVEIIIDDLVALREALEKICQTDGTMYIHMISDQALTESRARMKAIGIE